MYMYRTVVMILLESACVRIRLLVTPAPGIKDDGLRPGLSIVLFESPSISIYAMNGEVRVHASAAGTLATS